MGCNKILRIILLAVMICVLISHRQHTVRGTPTNIDSSSNHNHPDPGSGSGSGRNRLTRFGSRVASQYARARLEPDFILDDDDLFDLTKRQSDDYGHMRFGKREFDDYGHMRFGRSESD